MKLVSSYFPSAVQDMNEITEYFDTHTDIVMDNVSSRFQQAVAATVDLLCESPELGERFRCGKTAQIRRRQVQHFKNYVIYYSKDNTALCVIRILHAARNVQKLFRQPMIDKHPVSSDD